MISKEPIDRIRSLLKTLPLSDIDKGKEFLNKRDFESLQFLIDSAIIRVKRGLLKEQIKDEYLKVDLSELDKLKSEVDIYCIALELPRQEIDYDDFNNENFNTY